jgi:hypothetical protein
VLVNIDRLATKASKLDTINSELPVNSKENSHMKKNYAENSKSTNIDFSAEAPYNSDISKDNIVMGHYGSDDEKPSGPQLRIDYEPEEEGANGWSEKLVKEARYRNNIIQGFKEQKKYLTLGVNESEFHNPNSQRAQGQISGSRNDRLGLRDTINEQAGDWSHGESQSRGVRETDKEISN